MAAGRDASAENGAGPSEDVPALRAALSDARAEIEGLTAQIHNQAHGADAGFLRSVLAASDECIKILDLDGRLIFMTDAGRRIMEVSDFEAIKGCPWPDFWQDEGNREAKAAVAAAAAGGVGRFRGAANTMAGQLRYWDVQVRPIHGADGRPERLLSISRDITTEWEAEQALREARGMSAPMLESSRDSIVVLDLEGNTLFVSPGGIEGMDVADVDAILGLSWLQNWKDADHAAARAAVAAAREGKTSRFQGYSSTQKGTPKWWDVVISPLLGPNGAPERLLSVGRDITELKQAEVRLAAQIELGDKLRDLDDPAEMAFIAGEIMARTLSVSRAGYGTIDPVRETITIERDWNAPGIQSIAGTLRFRDFGSYIDDLKSGRAAVVTDAFKDARTAAEASALTAISARSFINLPVFEHGVFAALFFVNHAEPRGWTSEDEAFVHNVADRTHAASELRRAEMRLRSLAASLEQQVAERTLDRNRLWQLSTDVVLVAHFDGTVVAANPAWQTLLGWGESDLVGLNFLDLVHPEDLESTKEAAKSLSEGTTVRRFDNRYRHRDGSHRWFAWAAVPGGDLINAVGRDITVEKEQAEALQQTEELLRQSQKMEAVGQLTGGIAHDFNNLLAGITGSLQLMQTRVAQGRITEIDRYLAAALGASQRAAALTHRLLAFSRQQTLDPKPIVINRLVAGMEELVRRTVGPSVTVELICAVGLWSSLIDPNQLENALLNLCINGRDAMPNGGKLIIETANRWLGEREARLRDVPPGQYVSLCVSDNGTGMSPDVIRRAFDPFFTTKPPGSGTGLGLSMIYGFVRQSGGLVRIYSELGQGTMVCLYLPRHFGEAAAIETDAASSQLQQGRSGETVLVVDDEPTVRMLVTEVLQDLGYAVLEAVDGPAALQIMQSNVQVDLMVTDVGLPGGMTGRQLAQAARVLRPNLKVLFITGYAENAVFSHGHLEPGMQVLTKPFELHALASKIQDLIALR